MLNFGLSQTLAVRRAKVPEVLPKRQLISVSNDAFDKDRYTGHKYTFNHINKKNSTRLSDFVWQYFSRYGKKPDMKWSIVHHVKGNIGGASKICQLCNLERLAIAAENKQHLLNKRQDISNNCVHNRRFFFN